MHGVHVYKFSLLFKKTTLPAKLERQPRQRPQPARDSVHVRALESHGRPARRLVLEDGDGVEADLAPLPEADVLNEGALAAARHVVKAEKEVFREIRLSCGFAEAGVEAAPVAIEQIRVAKHEIRCNGFRRVVREKMQTIK